MRARLLVFAILAAIPLTAYASWVSNITGIDINVPAGTVSVSRPNPAAIPEMLRNLPNDVRQFVTNPAGSFAATAIRHAAAQARYGARPMPSEIRAVLSPYFPAGILDKASWNNTKLVKGDLAAEIRRMKKEPGEDLVILGSGSIVSQLAQEGLIDAYQVVVNPIVLGKGRTMFEGIKDRLNLKLTKTRTFGNGNVFLSYEPAA